MYFTTTLRPRTVAHAPQLNTCYPDAEGVHTVPTPPTLKDFMGGMRAPDMDDVSFSGPQLKIDTADFSAPDSDAVPSRL